MFLKTFQTKFLLNTLKGLSKICFLKHSLKCTTFSHWLLRFFTTKKILLLWCTCAKWSKVIKNSNILLTFLTQHHDHPDLFFTTSEHAKVIISHQTSFASLLKTCYGPLGITTTRASVKLINCSILLNFTLFLTVVIPTVNTENATSSS